MFYYIYGLFHLPAYKERYEHNLQKALPRIPFIKDFTAFKEAGKKLAELHVNYEKQTFYKGCHIHDSKEQKLARYSQAELHKHYRVTKMRFQGKDKSTIIYNGRISITGIPEKAYEYQVNGFNPVKWVMERQKVHVDKESDIKTDPNDYATESENNPRYPLELIGKAVTVSLETQKIVDELKKQDVDFESDGILIEGPMKISDHGGGEEGVAQCEKAA